jgi:hypothetical protein
MRRRSLSAAKNPYLINLENKTKERIIKNELGNSIKAVKALCQREK